MSRQMWRRCSSCKKEIFEVSKYYVCSVSTCRQKKTDYVFCGIECWDRHIPVERHRSDNVSAIEKTAPRSSDLQEAPSRRVVVSASGSKGSSFASPASASTSVDGQVLVVASKVKKYISDRSQMNTSASSFDALSDRIRQICDQSIQNARADGRKTVMDRDVPKISF